MKKRFAYKTKTVAAFTLPEVVVSVFLMAILFTVGTFIYTIISQQFRVSAEKNRFYSNYYVTQKVMRSDMGKAFTATVTDDNTVINLQMNRDAAAAETILYKMDSAYILRVQGERTDTLLPGGTIAAYKTLSDTIPLANYIKIEHRYGQRPFFTYLEKHYASEQILSYNPQP
jgi:type II secretory pathway pseudopilin PulG